MTNAGICIQRSLEANPLREPVLRAAIQSLGLPLGSNGLDAGSGIGLQALLLAEAVGPDGHITGIDIVLELLAFGNDHVRRAGFSEDAPCKKPANKRLNATIRHFAMATRIPDRLIWAVEQLSVNSGDEILEIGCGTGVAASLICSRLADGHLTAIDRSESMIDTARRRNQAHD